MRRPNIPIEKVQQYDEEAFKAYWDGLDAFESGISLEDNPFYNLIDRLHKAWHAGWIEACRMHEWRKQSLVTFK